MGSKKKTTQTQTATQTTTNTDNSAVARGEGSIALSGGSSLKIESLDAETVEKSLDFAGNTVETVFDFAGDAQKQANAVVSKTLDLQADQNAAAADLASQVIDSADRARAQDQAFVESTREGNNQIAAESIRTAFALAEKRTGTDSDNAFSAGKIFLYVLAAVAALFFITINRKK